MTQTHDKTQDIYIHILQNTNVNSKEYEATKMPQSIESSTSLQNNHSFLPKMNTSSPLQIPCKCLINQTTINNPIQTHKEVSQPLTPSKPSRNEGWALTLLHECVRAISDKNIKKSKQLLWALNELASPYGDCNQRLAYYFSQAIFTKATKSGPRWFENLQLVAEKNYCFDTYIKLLLKFQEVSPWTTFGHVASNGAIMEALEGEEKLHIIDLSDTLCTQWPTLFEALALRSNDTPFLKLTLVMTTNLERLFVKEISQKMEKFARLMGVPFKLQVISGLKNLGELRKEDLELEDDEAIIVNCVQALQRVRVDKREDVINMIQSIKPRIVTIVEEEADFTTYRNDFVKSFEELFRFFSLYFEILEESFPLISNERLKIERDQSRNIMSILACNGEIGEEIYLTEKAVQWATRLKQAFRPIHYSDDVLGDVKALLRRYRVGWDVELLHTYDEVGMHLKWRGEPVVWASAWKPMANLSKGQDNP